MRLKLAAASFVFWAAFIVFGMKPSHLCLAGSQADAPAHVDSTILFGYRGFDVYRAPIAKLGIRSHTDLARDYSSRYGWGSDGITDMLDIPQRAGKPPLLVNWSYLPRPYPPGVFLYFLPEAVLKETFGLSPKTAATLSLLKLTAVAHVFLWLFASMALPIKGEGETPRELAVWIILPVVYLETMLWTLHGFFDAAALIPLLLSIRALRGRRGLDAVFWYSVSVFLHFRTLWFMPVAFRGAHHFWKNKEYQRLGGCGLPLVLSSVVMLALSAYAFVLVYPWLRTLQPTNYFLMNGEPARWARLPYLLAPMTLIAGALGLNRAGLVVACLGWTLVMIARSPFLQFWHAWYLTPLFAMTGLGELSAARTKVFALLAYFVLASLAFSYFCFNGLLIQDVLQELWG